MSRDTTYAPLTRLRSRGLTAKSSSSDYMGDYTGGELVFTDKASPNYGTHNIKNRWLRFDGSTEHYVKPFKGERYTLVYYHWS